MDHKKIKVAMMIAVSKALGYKEGLKGLSEILNACGVKTYKKAPPIVTNKDKKERIATIIAISKAIKYREEHPEAEEKEIMSYILNEVDDIITKVEKS